MPTTKKWETTIQSLLVGRTIKGVRYLTPKEADEMGWGHRPLVIELDHGIELMPMSDDEGNNGGAIATNIKSCQCIPVMRGGA